MGQHARPETKRGAKTAPTPRLKAGTIRVPRSNGVFIGYHDRSIIISGLGAAAVTELLDGRHSRLDIAIATGTPRERVDHIVNLLASHGLVDRDYQENAFTPAIAERMEPELAAAAIRPTSDDGGLSLFLNRQRLTVDVYGLDRIGSQVMALLSAGGIGALRVRDERKVSSVDVAGGVYRMSDVGHERRQVATAIMRDSSPLDLRRPSSTPSLAIYCGLPTPEDLLQLSLNSVPYLLVHTDPRQITVGPLVVPSKTACARCIALHHADLDEEFGLIELARMVKHGRNIPAATTAALAAAITSAHALTFLDTGNAPTVGATMTCDPTTGLSRLHPWSKHPLCGCAWSGCAWDHHHS